MDPGVTTQLDDEPTAVPDDVAVVVDELSRLAQLLNEGFGDRSSDTAHGR